MATAYQQFEGVMWGLYVVWVFLMKGPGAGTPFSYLYSWGSASVCANSSLPSPGMFNLSCDGQFYCMSGIEDCSCRCLPICVSLLLGIPSCELPTYAPYHICGIIPSLVAACRLLTRQHDLAHGIFHTVLVMACWPIVQFGLTFQKELVCSQGDLLLDL